MGKHADCERIVQEAVDGLGGLDVIIANAVCSNVRLQCLVPRKDHCNIMTLSDVQRVGQCSQNSGILTLSLKPSGTRYGSKISVECR